MESFILNSHLEYFIRERVLVIGNKGCGKSKLIEKLLGKQYIDVDRLKIIDNNSPLFNNEKHKKSNVKSNETNNWNTFCDWLKSPPTINDNVDDDDEIKNASKETTKEINCFDHSLINIDTLDCMRFVSKYYYHLNHYDNANIMMFIWDVSAFSLELFLKNRTTTIIQQPQTILLLYDSNDANGLNNVIEICKNYSFLLFGPNKKLTTIYLVATKIDIGFTAPMPYKYHKWIHENNIRHYYISSEYNKGIDTLRHILLYTIWQKHQQNYLSIHRKQLIQSYRQYKYQNNCKNDDDCFIFNNQINNNFNKNQTNCSLCAIGSLSINFDKLLQSPDVLRRFYYEHEIISTILKSLISNKLLLNYNDDDIEKEKEKRRQQQKEELEQWIQQQTLLLNKKLRL